MPGVSDSVGLRWDVRICISKKFLHDTDVDPQDHTLGTKFNYCVKMDPKGKICEFHCCQIFCQSTLILPSKLLKSIQGLSYIVTEIMVGNII